MSLYELSIQYHAAADALRGRMRELRAREKDAGDEAERQSLLNRIRILNTMWAQTHEIAVLTEHYYERNHRRNAKHFL